jgi:membrane protein YdbS with pleckstrin-like domain
VTDKRYKPTEAPLAEQQSTSDSGSKWSLGPRIIFAIGWFVFCSGYLLRAALKSQSWWTTVIGSAVAIAVLIALCGVLRKWRWSQWIIYTFVLEIKWGVIQLRARRASLPRAGRRILS